MLLTLRFEENVMGLGGVGNGNVHALTLVFGQALRESLVLHGAVLKNFITDLLAQVAQRVTAKGGAGLVGQQGAGVAAAAYVQLRDWEDLVNLLFVKFEQLRQAEVGRRLGVPKAAP